MTTRNKVKGMLIGGAIGDALGAPVEMWNPQKICEVHGGPVTRYVAPIEHKWFKVGEFLPGMTTDDTQLTVATMEGFIKGHEKGNMTKNFEPYLDAMAIAHVEASKHAVGGWGTTTQEAVRRLANGVHWSESGKSSEPNRGTGNGVPMKCSPFAAWRTTQTDLDFIKEAVFRFNERVVQFSAMTHYTQVSAHAAVVHTEAVSRCLYERPGETNIRSFKNFSVLCETYCVEHLQPSEDDLFERFRTLQPERLQAMTVEEIRKEYGGAGCYVYDSLPFSYAIFLRNLNSMNGIIEAANAGGDNDTNAKIVGELLGAKEGLDIFLQPENKWAVEGLRDYDKLIALADRFCDTFGIE